MMAKNLEEKQWDNAYLYEEIREIRDQREEFEEQREFQEKFLEEKVLKLEAVIERLYYGNDITKNNYINKIKDLNQKTSYKNKNTIDRFESVLSNNQELLDKDLYTVYRELKLNFELKLKNASNSRKNWNSKKSLENSN